MRPDIDDDNSVFNDEDSTTNLVNNNSPVRVTRWVSLNGICLFNLFVIFSFGGIGAGIFIAVYSFGMESPTQLVNGSEYGDERKYILPSKVPKNLQSVCSPLSIQSEEGYDKCLELCYPSHCCSYESNSQLSCLNDYRSECEQYRSSCQHLDHARSKQSGMQVDQVCSIQSLMTHDGVKACQDICEPFQCCFNKDRDIKCNISESLCFEHGACVASTNSLDNVLNSYEEATEFVNQACNDLSTYEGQTKCSSICNQASCCFVTDSLWKRSCNLPCNQYTACSSLYGPIQANNPSLYGSNVSVYDQIEHTCDLKKLETLHGIRSCLEICEHHLCCLSGPQNGCSTMNSVGCDEYHACWPLLQSINGDKKSPSESCSLRYIQAHGSLECLHSCSENLCCLLDARFQSSCASDNECSTTFKPCSILAPKKSEMEETDFLEQIQKFCTTSTLETALGIRECERLCSKRRCCFTSNAGNCKSLEPLYCDQVKSCDLLTDYITVYPNSKTYIPQSDGIVASNFLTDELDIICRETNLLTLSGYHNCYEQCYFHLCCFSKDAGLKCTNDLDCSQFAPCKTLVNTSGNIDHHLLDDSCSESSVGTSSGLEECRRHCAPFLCCFQDPDLPSSCIHWYGEKICAEMEPCRILTSSFNNTLYKEDPYQVALINNYCSQDSTSNSVLASKCMLHCRKRACCFDSGGCYKSVS
jgi:hypothetical protein